MRYSALGKLGMACLLACSALVQAYADVRLPALVGSNMVLQRNRPLRIWGWADANEQVSVQFMNKTYKTAADAGGKWQVQLPAQKAGGPYTITISGNNTITLDNVMVGEVWLASGQSNMQMPLEGWGKILNYQQEIAAANYPDIRLFQVTHTTSTAPQDDVPTWGGWKPCSPQSVPEFSAVAYTFAREIYKKEHIPVGVIHSSWGGTIAEAWTSGEALKSMPAFADTVRKFESLPAPESPKGPNKPTLLYNAMIHPLLNYAIRGAIWYQGESNAGRAYQYRELFPLMITDWRKQWKEGDFPFLFVQLANYKAVKPEPAESDWAELREAQLLTLSLPNTGMASAIDIGEEKDIHPKNKQEVGRRLALIALNKVYGEKIPCSGPLYRSMKIKGNKVTLAFDHATGLQARGGELKGFAVAGEDRQFHWAQAKVEGKHVVVSCPEVPKPVAVRYGWADNPQCNLYNAAGLPASPFRTDDWQGITYGKN